eukprot:jgi/Mesen1/5909/ME000030S05171
MDLPPAPWESTGAGPELNAGASQGLVALVASLTKQRQSRELGLSLRRGLQESSADYPHVRVRGLQALGAVVDAAASSEAWAALFCESQCYQELQIVSSICEHSLGPQQRPPGAPQDPFAGRPPAAIWHESTEEEVVTSLRLLEGCCLLDSTSRHVAAQHSVAKALVERMGREGCTEVEAMACMDALLAALLENPPALQEFEECKGVKQIGQVLRDRSKPLPVRLKGAEMLMLLLNQVLPVSAPESSRSLTKDGAIEELSGVIGALAATLLSDIDFESTAAGLNLQRQAERILDAVD